MSSLSGGRQRYQLTSEPSSFLGAADVWKLRGDDLRHGQASEERLQFRGRVWQMVGGGVGPLRQERRLRRQSNEAEIGTWGKAQAPKSGSQRRRDTERVVSRKER